MMVTEKTLVEKATRTPQGMRLFQQEAFILEVTEAVCEIMEKEKITRSKLAERLEKTKGYVTQVLSGRTNLTLRTVSDLFTALGKAARINLIPIAWSVGPPGGCVASVQLTEWRTDEASWSPTQITVGPPENLVSPQEYARAV